MMPRTYFSPPWDPTPDNWERLGLSEIPSLPGLTDDCAVPKPSSTPVVHRYLDIFIRNDLDLPFTDMPYVNSDALHSQRMPQAAQIEYCDLAESFCDRSWQVRRPVWALAVIYEQAWHWLGSALGELADSISLTPGEKLEVQIFTWDRRKLSEDLQTSDLVDRKTESSLTVHASAHVVKRMEEQTQWQLGANVGFSSGVTAGIEASYGESTTDSIERRREQRQDQTRKTAQQVRSERQLKISTSRETGIEERRKRVLKNDNPTRTVTYNFYQTVAHYRVDLAIVETQTAIGLPNRLPRITPDWVVCHEGILREVLLDPNQEGGFGAARDLKRGSDLERDIIAAAARRLQNAFANRNTTAVELEPEEVIPPPSFGEAFVRALLGGLTLGGSEAVFGTVDLVTYLSQAPSESAVDRPSGAEIEEFLLGAVESPSLNGLLVGLKMVADYHVPWSLGRFGRFERSNMYIMTEEIDRAIGYAKAAALAMAAAVSPEISGVEGEGEEAVQAAQANQAAWLEWKADQAEKYAVWRNARALFEGLKCHIETHLLHYMRPIWTAEDPAIRIKRHARELGFGEAELAQFVKQPLLGFHLNCCVYPCEPPAFENVVPMMARMSKDLRHQISDVLRRRAIRRFENEAQRLLAVTVDSAVHRITTCENEGKPLTVDVLPKVLAEASEQITALSDEVTRGDGWKRYLSNQDQALMASMESRARELERAQEDAREAIQNGLISEIAQTHATADERIRDLNENRDFKSIMVVLPDGGYHCEPVVGHCSAAEKLHERQLDAETRSSEASADRLRKRVDDLPADQLEAESSPPVIEVHLRNDD
jgi:hypothetical protein